MTRAVKIVSSKLVDVVDVVKVVFIWGKHWEQVDGTWQPGISLASAWQHLFTVELFVWFPKACFNSRISCAVNNILWIGDLFWNFLSDVFDKSWFFLAVVSFWLAFIRLYDTWRCAKYHVDVEKVDATTCHYKCFLVVTMPNFALQSFDSNFSLSNQISKNKKNITFISGIVTSAILHLGWPS